MSFKVTGLHVDINEHGVNVTPRQKCHVTVCITQIVPFDVTIKLFNQFLVFDFILINCMKQG